MTARGFLLFVSLALLAVPVLANHPPDAPQIFEPSADVAISPDDVHMVTSDFHDPDPGDEHLCTDWEIVEAEGRRRIWSAHCVAGFLRVHIHLGDGIFDVPGTTKGSLAPDQSFLIRARHRDSSGDPATEWSPWSERTFHTAKVLGVPPMQLRDIASDPAPAWTAEDGGAVVLPASPAASSLRVASAGGFVFLEARSLDGSENQWLNPEGEEEHEPVRVEITNGSSTLSLELPPSSLSFEDDHGEAETIWMPALSVDPDSTSVLWASSNGSTHWGSADQTAPDFSMIARGAPVPWRVLEPGYRVDQVVGGLQLPVAIAFVPDPGDQPGDPLFYVAELYGTIRVVHRDGTVGEYATDLLNFDPLGEFPGSGEIGVGSIAVDPDSGDLFATELYAPSPEHPGSFFPRILRLKSDPSGEHAEAVEVVLDMVGQPMGPSHQISNITIGPDGMLYVHLADGACLQCAEIVDSFLGKIIRLTKDGSAPADNPFYDAADGITAKDYVYALGFRNPFGGAWRMTDGHHYEAENGPSVDRIARVIPGADYGWNGTNESMRTGALYNYMLPAAPVNMAFIQPETFGGSGFPWWKQDLAFVSESGPTWATGPQWVGKRIGQFVITPAGSLSGDRETFVEYDGSGKATVAALAAGPDGLYFSDLYPDDELENPTARKANVFRVSRTEAASMGVSFSSSGAGCGEIRFSDRSTVAQPISWSWQFDDGEVSAEQNPVHSFQRCGVRTVTLTVSRGDGSAETVKEQVEARVGDGTGLRGEYFRDDEFQDLVATRVDPSIDFDWSSSPVAGVDEPVSIRWFGRVRPEVSQVHRITITATSGIRLWINNVPVLDDWDGEGLRDVSGNVVLAAGREVLIRLELRRASAGSAIRLAWESESLDREVVPTGVLYPGKPLRRRGARLR